MIFARETLMDCMKEVMPLLKKHYAEVGAWREIPLDPDWDKYAMLEHVGALRVYTARLDQGELVGYLSMIVDNSLHHKTMKTALQDALYVHPGHRGMDGKIIEYADSQLRDEGVNVVYQHVTEYCNFGALLKNLGYKRVDSLYGKQLNGGK